MKKTIIIIVVAQFFCTSLWFAGNAILSDLIVNLKLPASFLAHLTSSVQFGFIAGTFIFALLSISDKYSPSKVFALSAFIAAVFNLGMAIDGLYPFGILLLRFFTGFFLAGIYPVGMKIASDHDQKGLGKSLGFLVGALVLGTAFPHLLKSFSAQFPWKMVIYFTSVLAMFGGTIIYFFVPDGPYGKPNLNIKLNAFFNGFKDPTFKTAAFGYFGHMWELYTFWAFVPIILSQNSSFIGFNNSIYSFIIIAVGCLACIFSGLLSQKFGVKKIAFFALSLSAICCLTSPLFLNQSKNVTLVFLIFWGMVVVADSPLFSTMVAQNAPQQNRGTALTIVNCIGFSITIISIQFLQIMSVYIDNRFLYVILAIGPILGLLALRRNSTYT